MKIDTSNSWYGPMRQADIAVGQKSQNDTPPAAGPTPSAPPADTTAGKNVATREGQDQAPQTPGESLMDRILNGGFQKFVADLEAEKMAKLREKLLNAMGLNEDMLAHMSPEQRQAVEELIAEEIKRRLEAAQKMNGNEPSPIGAVRSSGPAESGAATDAATGSKPGSNTGLGVLLALQEVDADGVESRLVTEAEKHGKKDLSVL